MGVIKNILDSFLPLLIISPEAQLIVSILVIALSLTWALTVFKLTSGSGIDDFIHPEESAYKKFKIELSNFQTNHRETYAKYPLPQSQPSGT